MKVLRLSPITSAMSFAIALAAPTASGAAEIKVLTSRAMNHVLTEIVAELVQQGKIASDSKVSLALVGIGVAVRTGSARPDITSVAQFSHYRLSIPARNQQVEQNRASPLFVHQYQLAG
jgi:hypothetical protein